MSFDFDDNLITTKRKNSSPARFTNLLIVAGFMSLALLLIFLMNGSSDSKSLTESQVEATIDARVQEILASELQTTPSKSDDTSLSVAQIEQPTVEPRPTIEGKRLIPSSETRGIITDEVFEIDYSYNAIAGTPIVITIRGQGLATPALILTNPLGNKVIATATANQSIGSSSIHVIATILPMDGQYIITATRQDGRAGNDEGDFVLNFDIPKSLDTNWSMANTITSDSWDWYVYHIDSPFSLIYQFESGEFKPDVGVYRLNLYSELISVGYLPGTDVDYGVIGRFEEDITHFIAVGQPAINANHNQPVTTGTYKIGIQLAK